MEEHWKLTDGEFERQFESCTLPDSLFTHEAHLRLAWIHIQKYGPAQAELNLCSQIQQYATSLGGADKFHKTVTVAAIRAINHFISRSKSIQFEVFLKEFPRLKNDFKGLMDAHYSFNIFAHEKARIEFVEPDMVDFC